MSLVSSFKSCCRLLRSVVNSFKIDRIIVKIKEGETAQIAPQLLTREVLIDILGNQFKPYAEKVWEVHRDLMGVYRSNQDTLSLSIQETQSAITFGYRIKTRFSNVLIFINAEPTTETEQQISRFLFGVAGIYPVVNGVESIKDSSCVFPNPEFRDYVRVIYGADPSEHGVLFSMNRFHSSDGSFHENRYGICFSTRLVANCDNHPLVCMMVFEDKT